MRPVKIRLFIKLMVITPMRINLSKLNESLRFLIFSFSISLILIFPAASLFAVEIDSTRENSIPFKIDETSEGMTQKEMNDLFGEDPYLGQTSYLQSPDGFIQREN